MTLGSRLRSWLRATLFRSRMESGMDTELRFHIDSYAQDLVRTGTQLPEALRRARLEFGGIERTKEECREARGVTFFASLSQDLRYALRMLRRNPGFTAVAVLTLALGIGANTAIFSVVYAVLLKPLPYPHSEQLFNVFQVQAKQAGAAAGWSYPNFENLRDHNSVFTQIAGVTRHQLTLTARGEPSTVNTAVVTPELFSVFEEKPLAGRTFRPDDGKPGAPPVVVLSEGLWRGRLGADPHIIGSSVALDKRSFTVIGIVPGAFRFPALTQTEQVWIPLPQDPLFGALIPRRNVHLLQVTGRLRPGVSAGQAQAEIDGIAARLAKAFPAENDGWDARMVPLRQMIAGSAKSPLLVLFGAVGLVLLIACANIANLLLTRATSRSREIAVRTTLGAGRARIVRQLLSEAVLLGVLGGAAGVALAYFGVLGLMRLLPATLPQVNAIRVDNLVLGFALLLSVFASCAFGLAPAMFATRSDLQTSLREGGARSGETGGRRRARGFLVAGEIALAMVLLMAAGLLLRSFAGLMSVSPGFEVRNIVKADVSLPQFQYSKPAQWAAFSDQLLERLQSQPGMRDSAIVVPLPIAENRVELPFDIVGNPAPSAAAARTADFISVSPKYFGVMKIPLIAGRFFDPHDSMSAPRVSVVSQAFARRYFPHRNPLGQRLRFGFPRGSEGDQREIVGIVGDVRDASLGEDPGPMMYVPFAQAPFWGGAVVVNSALSPSVVVAAIRQEVRKMDKDLPVDSIHTMPELMATSLAQPRFRTFLLGLFAAMALVLAATGVFGVISYSVLSRTSEIGIRVALGASGGGILRMILRETMMLVFAGLALGIPGALLASRLLGHMLFGVSATDPATLAVVAFTLTTVAALAGYIPARRAMRVDPILALKYE